MLAFFTSFTFDLMSAFGANTRCLLYAGGPLGHAVEAGKSGGNLGLTLTVCGEILRARGAGACERTCKML